MFFTGFVRRLREFARQNSTVLQNKTALVVGGTQGIGEGSAINFARLGASVIVTGRNRGLGEEVLKELNTANDKGEHAFVPLDVTDIDAVDQFCSEINKQYAQKGLDVLCICCGGPIVQRAFEPSVNGIDRILHVNVLGRLQIVERLAPLVSKSHGRIIDVLAPGNQMAVDVKKHLNWRINSFGPIERLLMGGVCHDLYAKNFSEKYPGIGYVHLFPKQVVTRALKNSGTPAPIAWIFYNLANIFSYVHFLFLTKEECGLAVARMASSPKYAAGAHYVDIEDGACRPHPQINDPVIRNSVCDYILSLMNKKA